MKHHVLKVCKNRGNDRIWMEGDKLATQGWHQGREYVLVVMPDSLHLCRKGTFHHLNLGEQGGTVRGERKVAGTARRPIIDMNGKWLTKWMRRAKRYTATISPESIIITRGDKAARKGS